jgi:hypothetical protein
MLAGEFRQMTLVLFLGINMALIMEQHIDFIG